MQTSSFAIDNMERIEIQEDNVSKQKKFEIKDFGKDQNIQSDVQKQTRDYLYPKEIAIKRRVKKFVQCFQSYDPFDREGQTH